MAPKTAPPTVLALATLQPTESQSIFQNLLKYWWVFTIGLFLRTYVILTTSNIDQYLPVKYTDIDYLVFSDASALLSQGYSPYDRATYRYSPLLAYFLLPTATLHEQYGKHLFALCDIIVAIFIFILLLQMSQGGHIPYKVTPKQALCMSLFYVFNPLAINLSTRGSMDVLHITILYSFLLFFYNQWWITSGILYGLAVHVRIYPFIFALPIFFTFWMWRKYGLYGFESSSNNSDQFDESKKNRHKAVQNVSDTTTTFLFKSKVSQFCSDFFATLFHPISLQFILAAIIVNVALIAIFYAKFGYTFLYETYLYHIVRKDTRHSFSPIFLMLYLVADSVQSFFHSFPQLTTFSITPSIPTDLPSPTTLSQLIHFFTQFQFQQHMPLFCFIQKFLSLSWGILSSSITFILLGALPLITLHPQPTQQHLTSKSNPNLSPKAHIFPLPIIILLLSIFFVCKNSVVTAQYFLWFISFIPLYLPYLFCELVSSTSTSSKQTTTTQPTPLHSNSILAFIYTYISYPTLIQLGKLLASCLFWLVSELLWLATGFFIEVRGIGGIAWVLMSIVSIWLYLVHIWIFSTVLVHVLGYNSISNALGCENFVRQTAQIQHETNSIAQLRPIRSKPRSVYTQDSDDELEQDGNPAQANQLYKTNTQSGKNDKTIKLTTKPDVEESKSIKKPMSPFRSLKISNKTPAPRRSISRRARAGGESEYNSLD